MAGQKAVNPHGVIGELKDTLRELMRENAESLAANFAAVFDRGIRDLVIGGVEKAQADEGTIWVIDEHRSSWFQSTTLVPGRLNSSGEVSPESARRHDQYGDRHRAADLRERLSRIKGRIALWTADLAWRRAP